jgi:hypothetical protein
MGKLYENVGKKEDQEAIPKASCGQDNKAIIRL